MTVKLLIEVCAKENEVFKVSVAYWRCCWCTARLHVVWRKICLIVFYSYHLPNPFLLFFYWLYFIVNNQFLTANFCKIAFGICWCFFFRNFLCWSFLSCLQNLGLVRMVYLSFQFVSTFKNQICLQIRDEFWMFF